MRLVIVVLWLIGDVKDKITVNELCNYLPKLFDKVLSKHSQILIRCDIIRNDLPSSPLVKQNPLSTTPVLQLSGTYNSNNKADLQVASNVRATETIILSFCFFSFAPLHLQQTKKPSS